MASIFSNFNSGTITDNPLLIGATSMNSAALASLPEVVAPNTMWLVLDPTASAGAPEVVQVTAHASAATVATIARGQQSSAARQHALGITWIHAVTKSDMDLLPHRLMTAKGDLLGATAANTPARLAVGTNDKVLTAASGESTGLKWAYYAPPLCQVSMSATQSIPDSTNTTILFDTEDLDASGWHSTASNTGRVTPSTAGWYRATFTMTWGSDTDYTRTSVFVLKNGTAVSPTTGDTRGSGGTIPTVSGATTLIQMNGSTDYLELRAFQQNTSAGAETIQGRFLLELVSAT